MMPAILYEDNHLIVCVKPAGVLSQRDIRGGDDMLTILKDYIREKYRKPGNVFLGLVHRLDQNVGGVMVFARTSKAAARLSAAIRERDVTKRYRAVVEGLLPVGAAGTLSDRLAKDESTRTAVVSDAGKEALLDYVVLAAGERDGVPRTLLDITIRTGRFHQIRAQFAHAGHPVVGDVKYGAKPASEGLALHAVELSFDHPVTGLPLSFRDIPRGGAFSGFDV